MAMSHGCFDGHMTFYVCVCECVYHVMCHEALVEVKKKHNVQRGAHVYAAYKKTTCKGVTKDTHVSGV